MYTAQVLVLFGSHMSKVNYRWVIIFLLFSLNVISYIDRSAIAYAVPMMISSLGLSLSSMGLILGAFGIGYLITTFFGGIAVDKVGARVVVLFFIVIWAISMGVTGLIQGVTLGVIARFGLGLGEGPVFPAVAQTVNSWLPMQDRAKGFANSLVAVPISLAIGAPIVTGLLALVGWRWMFFILAILVCVWWPFFYKYFSNKPKQQEQVPEQKLKDFWRHFWSSKTLLSNCWGFFVFGYALFFFMTWLPDYLQHSLHMSLKQVGLFGFLPWMLAAIFLWLVGYLSDYVYRKTNSLRKARSYLIMLGQLLSLFCLIPIVISHDIDVILVAVSLAVAFNLSNNTVFYSVNLDVAKQRAGTSLGVMNSGLAISGFLAPSITGYLVAATGVFSSAFYLMVGLMLSSIIVVFIFHWPDQELETF